MSAIKVVPVNTPAGILQSQSAFFLRDVNFNPAQRLLILRGEVNAKYAKTLISHPKQTSIPFSVLFKGVRSFDCVNYDDFEAHHGAESKSNFDHVMSVGDTANSKNLYWMWFYDDVFIVHADGYAFSGFASAG